MSGLVSAAPHWDARVGITVGAAVVLATLAAIWLGLEDPWWAAITAWRVVDPQPTVTLDRSVQRFAGTVAGAWGGYMLAGLTTDIMLAQAVLIFAATAVCTYKRFTSARWSYGWVLGMVTVTMVLAESLDEPEGLYGFAVYRTLEILCGIVVATVVEAVMIALPVGPLPIAAPAPPSLPGGPETVRVALLVGAASLIVVLLWALLDIPALVPTIVSVVVVVDKDVIRLRARGWQRLAGCAAGGAFGLGGLWLGLDGFLPWAVALAGGVFLFSALAMGTGPNAYLGVQGGMAVITALVVGTGPPDQLEPIVERLAGIVIGVAVMVLLSFAMAPRPTPPPPTA
jgi:uncharacterized membrane protein YccC